MGDVDRSAVVMSIRKPYADAIMRGEKAWEFRRRPLPAGVRTVLVNVTGPWPSRRGVVGWFEVGGQATQAVFLWSSGPWSRGYSTVQVDPSYGISIDDLARYASRGVTVPAEVTGISVLRPVLLAEPIPLATLGLTCSPQSWQYAPTGWRDLLVAVPA